MRKKAQRLRVGKPIPTKSLNAIVEAAEEFDGLTVTPPLNLTEGPEGPQIAYGDAKGFWARLTGGTNPYSYQEVTWYGGAQHDVTGGRTGTTSVRPAYDANAITTLPSGWVDFLRPAFPGEYVFQSVRYGSGSCSAVATITVQCGGGGVNGASVSLTLGATTVSGTTGFTGNVNLTLTASGTWSGTVSKTGFTTRSFTLPFSCTSTSAIVAIDPTPITISGNVLGGACLLPASISVSQSATVVGTTTANSSGNYSLSVPNDGTAYTVTASHARYDSAISTFTLTGCQSTKTQNFTLTVSSGYQADGCDTANDPGGCGCCPLPAPDTLYINHGGYTITIPPGSGSVPLTVSISALSNTLLYCSDPTCTTSSQSVTFWFSYGGGNLSVSWARCALGTTCAGSTLPDIFSGADTWNPTDIAVNRHVRADCISGTNNPFLRTFDGAVTTPLGSGATVTE